MKSRRALPSFLLVTVVLLVVGVRVLRPKAQTDAPEAPRPELHSPYFVVGEGYGAYLFIRNNHVEKAITLDAVVSLSGGQRISLDPITVAPGETQRLELGSLLASKGVAASKALEGAATVSFPGQVDDEGFIKASVRVKNERTGVSFAFNFEPLAPEYGSNQLAGVWWRQDSNTRLKLAIYNPGKESRAGQATLWVKNGGVSLGSFALPGQSMITYDLSQALAASGMEEAMEGGVSISHDGAPSGLCHWRAGPR